MTKQAVEIYEKDDMIDESFTDSWNMSHLFPHDINTALYINYSAALTLRGMVLSDERRWVEAKEMFRKAYTLRKRLLKEENLYTAQAMALLGITEYNLGNKRRGLKLLKQAITTIKKINPKHHFAAFFYLEYAQILKQNGKYNEAATYARNVIESIEKSCGSHIHPKAAEAYCLLVDLALRNQETATEHYDKVHEIYAKLIERAEKHVSELGNEVDRSKLTYIQGWKDMKSEYKLPV